MLKLPSKMIILAFSALLATASSHAQYIWLDEKGGKQFSDSPPPISVPKNRILKTPSKTNIQTNISVKEPSTASNIATESGVNKKLQKPVTTTSKNEDFNKRKIEQEEKDKKADKEKLAQAEKTKNCERASSYQQSLQSGVRIARTDKNGERNFMTDAQREQELADVKRTISDCK